MKIFHVGILLCRLETVRIISPWQVGRLSAWEALIAIDPAQKAFRRDHVIVFCQKLKVLSKSLGCYEITVQNRVECLVSRRKKAVVATNDQWPLTDSPLTSCQKLFPLSY